MSKGFLQDDISIAIDHIKALYLLVLDYAKNHGLPTDKLKLFVNTEFADRLEFEDHLFLADDLSPLPVVRDSRIPETDLYVTDPDWGKSEDDF